MIPSQFTYHQPKSLTDALSLMRQFDGDGRVISGGMSLVPAMKLRLIQPEHLIDIGKLKEIRYIKKIPDGISIFVMSAIRLPISVKSFVSSAICKRLMEPNALPRIGVS